MPPSACPISNVSSSCSRKVTVTRFAPHDKHTPLPLQDNATRDSKRRQPRQSCVAPIGRSAWGQDRGRHRRRELENGSVATAILLIKETVPRQSMEEFMPLINSFKTATMKLVTEGRISSGRGGAASTLRPSRERPLAGLGLGKRSNLNLHVAGFVRRVGIQRPSGEIVSGRAEPSVRRSTSSYRRLGAWGAPPPFGGSTGCRPLRSSSFTRQ